MSEIKNLIAEDAVTKLQELVKASPTCMFATRLGEAPFHVCPMHVQETDYEGCLWFFSGADSTHNQQMAADPRVQLIFANHSNYEFLTVYGTATISQDREQIERLWNRMVEAWFPEGKEDSNLTLIRVQPTIAHYWDTENGKLVTMAKILTAAATGSEMDTGVEGSLNV